MDHCAKKETYPVLNPSNIIISEEELQTILSNFGINIPIKNIDLWRRVFIHKSYCKNVKKNNYINEYVLYPDNVDKTTLIPLQDDSNESLEWLGDSILQSVVGSYLWIRFPKQNEGFYTKLRSKLVKTESLSKLAKHLNLGKYILMSQYVEHMCNGRNNAKILEDTYEAFIGALVEDFGLDSSCNGYNYCYKFCINCIEEVIDMPELILKDDNYKDKLMRYFQKIYDGKFPKYNEDIVKMEENMKNANNRLFFIYINDPITKKKIGEGFGKSKRSAEQNAAKYALLYFGISDNFK